MVRSFSIHTIVFIFVITFAHSAFAADAPGSAIRIRIHDYANLETRAITRAQRIVSRLYQSIGVRTEWLESTRPLEDQTPAFECGSTDLTIIVLTPEMAGRRTVPEAVVGYAAVTPGEAGRVAFVIYDRVRDVARHADADVTHVLGMVMAHELGHLLLPNGAHSDGGLMRGHWNAADFRHLNTLDLGFSPAQAKAIHQTIAVAPLPLDLNRRAAGGTDKPVGLLATIVE